MFHLLDLIDLLSAQGMELLLPLHKPAGAASQHSAEIVYSYSCPIHRILHKQVRRAGLQLALLSLCQPLADRALCTRCAASLQ